jgi:hypothetical protein
MNFFVVVFFVSLGVGMELGQAAEHWLAIIVLSAFVLIGKLIIFLWIITRMGYAERTAFLTSVTVAQISEFSFIFAAAAVDSGLIDSSILSLVGVVGILTIAPSAYLIFYNHQVYEALHRRGLLRWTRATAPAASATAEGLRDHIIVVGLNALGRRIVHELVARGETVLAVDVSARNLEGLPSRTMLGNAEHLSLLEEAGIRHAKLLVSTLQIEETNHVLAHWGRVFGVPTSIHAFDQSMVEELRDAGADHLILSKSAGTRRIARAFREAGILT